MTAGERVLVVDDEPPLLRALDGSLTARGYVVDTALTPSAAMDVFDRERPDIVVVDLNMPGGDGHDVIRHVRSRGSTPIIVLSARAAESDKVIALDLGADDYVSKPFGTPELLARIRAALRRVAGPAGDDGVLIAGRLRVDLRRREVTVAGAMVRLTPTEYELLKAFARNPDRILTDRMLLKEVWGDRFTSESHYLHVYVARVRKKLAAAGAHRLVVTDPGVGYRLLVDGTEA
jgi:two-component system, OmpR family, KDP operon response regulator KdpE